MPDPSLTSAAWALRAQFFVSGALFATWGVHVPSVKAHYGLGEQALAVAMLAAGVGAIVALLQSGRWVARHGARRLARVMGVVSAACIAGLLAAPGYAGLLAVLLLYGAAASVFDVAINAQASEIETRSGRTLMSGFHALFSLGGLAGAGVGSALAAGEVAAVPHLVGAAVLCSVLVMVAARAMLPGHAAPGTTRPPLSLPRGPLALLGLLAAIGLVAEGAMYDWSVLFLRQERQAVPGLAALGYASFSGAMAAGRFGGDAVRARFAPATVLRASGLLAALGMVLALAVPHAAAGLVGFALVGLGLANVIPVLFSAATQVRGVAPAHGIAAVSSLGYLGMMAGPPLVGFIAEGRSLAVGLWTVVVFALAVTVAASRALSPATRTET